VIDTALWHRAFSFSCALSFANFQPELFIGAEAILGSDAVS
jgi:hypothetical protein